MIRTRTHMISSQTKEYVLVDIATTVAGASVDPTGDAVEFAATVPGVEPSAWLAGSWETDTTTDPDTYSARILVSGTGGGGTLVLADGTYDLWVRITDSPERPARRAGTLIVT